MASVNTDKLMAGLKKYFEFGQMAENIELVKANFWAALANGDVGDMIHEAVMQVEELARDIKDIEGSDKKQAIIDWLDSCVELPALLDAKPFNLDGRLFAPMIDATVKWINDQVTHGWFIEENEDDEEDDPPVVAGAADVGSDNGNGQ